MLEIVFQELTRATMADATKAETPAGRQANPAVMMRSLASKKTRETQLIASAIARPSRMKTVRKHWTPLIKTPKEVHMTENHDFKAPKPMTNKKGQDPDLYCDFHKDTHHLTDNCISLRQEIEKALKSGKLSHLVKNVRKETRQIQRNDDGNQKKVRRLETHMVNGPRQVQEERASAHLNQHGKNKKLFSQYTADIIYEQCFNQFDPEDKARLEPVDYPLSEFCNEAVFTLGQISFPVTLSNGKHSRTTNVNFMVMPVKSRHDVLIGRETQGELNMVTSTPHSGIGFPTETGVAIIYSKNEVMATEDARSVKANKVSPTEPEKWVLNRKYPKQTVTIGHAISSSIRTHFKQLLFRNMDIFAWTPSDMTGVPRDIIEHCLNKYPSIEPKVQRKRSLGSDKTKAMNEQVCELLKSGILREVRYQSWVANHVMVEKSTGGWHMCVDYTDLNKVCPRDCYSLPEIDKKIDSLAPFRWKCFLDYYKGYHQVQMKLEDEDKTAFRTDFGATYQRLMDKTFGDDIGKHIEVYIDDLVIKSPKEDQMLKDMGKTFNSLRSVNMKLNPAKCSFGMEEGKFLGFVVTNGGFKVNPEKVQAIERMPSSRTIKEMQRLVGLLAALNRFLSNHAAKSYPFISKLRNCVKKQEFKWTPKAEAAFQQMKECLIKLPTLTAPFEKEPLILYLSSSDKAIGSVLLVERDGVQTPIYYVSRVLTDPKTRYSTMEKLVLALLHASRRPSCKNRRHQAVWRNRQ
ncbi:putative nucleotidyltransferase, Ribonuclease H [Helianthus anomalus]